MNQMEILERITNCPVLVDLTSTQRADLETWIKDRGFEHYVGLLLGAKQAQLIALANCQLGSSELSCRASAIQGVIKGIDLALQSFVDLFPTAGDGALQ